MQCVGRRTGWFEGRRVGDAQGGAHAVHDNTQGGARERGTEHGGDGRTGDGDRTGDGGSVCSNGGVCGGIVVTGAMGGGCGGDSGR